MILNEVIAWKCNEWSDKNIKSLLPPGKNLTPKLKWIHNSKILQEFQWSCLKQDRATFAHRNVKKMFIICEWDIWSRDLNTKFTLGNYLFGDVNLTKHTDSNKYRCGGYEIVFDVRSPFAFQVVEWDTNAITFAVDNSS